MPRREFALVWRLTTLTPSIMTLRLRGSTSMMRPVLPLSLPVMTTTRSFFRTLISTFIIPQEQEFGVRKKAEAQCAGFLVHSAFELLATVYFFKSLPARG